MRLPSHLKVGNAGTHLWRENICATIFSVKKFQKYRMIEWGLRHVIRNLHVLEGPDDFNGYSFCLRSSVLDRRRCPSEKLSGACPVEIRCYTSSLFLKRTWDQISSGLSGPFEFAPSPPIGSCSWLSFQRKAFLGQKIPVITCISRVIDSNFLEEKQCEFFCNEP